MAKIKREQKRPNFGLCACPKLKYFTFLYLILVKSIRFVSAQHLQQDLGSFSVMAAQKLI